MNDTTKKPLPQIRKPEGVTDQRDEAVEQSAKKMTAAERMRAKNVQRLSPDDESADLFYLPPELRTEMDAQGLSYEFKTITVMGKEESPAHFMRIEQGGWEPFHFADFPKFKFMMMKDAAHDMLEAGGQRLYIRLRELTDQAREYDKQVADGRVRNIMPSLQDTPLGHIKPVQYGDASGIKRTVGRAVE